jgi:hypothetical protein
VMQHPQARRIFSQRKAIVEPVFSSLRSQQGLNRFRRRGLQAVKREFALHVLAHNLSRAVALSRALFTLLYAVLRGLHEVAHRFLNRFLDLLVRAKAITSTPGLQLDAQQKRFATASEGRGLSRFLVNERQHEHAIHARCNPRRASTLVTRICSGRLDQQVRSA